MRQSKMIKKGKHIKRYAHTKAIITALFVGMLILATHYSWAQLLTNQGQQIYIGEKTLITIKGDVLNKGSIVNQGEIALSGNWHNEGDYIANQGAIILSGVDQQFDHRQQEIYELVIEGGGKKYFQSGASINGRLYLTNGIIMPSSDLKLLAGPSLDIIGGSAQSYINGAFYHQGAGSKFFPIGKDNYYSPVSLHVYGNPIVGYEVFRPNKANYYALELREVSTLQYWQQDLVTGQIGTGSTITLPINVEFDQATEEAIAITGASSTEGTYKLLETIEYIGVINNGTITSYIDPNYNSFALGMLAESPEERALFIPNAFAPFSSSANEDDRSVKVYGKSISDEGFLFRIYNRWGAIVYETNSYDEAKTIGWDGVNKSTGKPETMGSYKYSLKGKFLSGKPIEKTGNIHLIR